MSAVLKSVNVKMYNGYQLISEFIKTCSPIYKSWGKDLRRETETKLLQYMDSTTLIFKTLLYNVFSLKHHEITGDWYNDFETWLITNNYAVNGENILLYFIDVEFNDWDYTAGTNDLEIVKSVNDSFNEVYAEMYGETN